MNSSQPVESRKARAARRAGEFPPAPAPLAVPVFDSHTHLNITVHEAGVPGGPAAPGVNDSEAAKVEALIAEAAKVGVGRLLQVGVDAASSRWGADLADGQSAV